MAEHTISPDTGDTASKIGMPVAWTTLDGDTITLTPRWSSTDGEAIDIHTDHRVSLRADEFNQLADVAQRLTLAYRSIWPVIPDQFMPECRLLVDDEATQGRRMHA